MSQMYADLEPRIVGVRLQEARKARGLTQQEAADDLGVARTTITAMEKGERTVQPGELRRLAALYGRSVHDLLRQREPVVDFTAQFRSLLSERALQAPET